MSRAVKGMWIAFFGILTNVCTVYDIIEMYKIINIIWEAGDPNISYANIFVIGKVLWSIVHCGLSMNHKSSPWQAFRNFNGFIWIVSIIIIVQNILYGLETSLPFSVAAKAVTMVTTDQTRLLIQPTKAGGLKNAVALPRNSRVPSPVRIHMTVHLSFIISKPSNLSIRTFLSG